MEFLRNLSETVNNAVDFVVEKNKKFAKITKVRKQLKKESNNIIKSYIKLGKHYYNDLRDVPNYEMQKLCQNIDVSKGEIKRLQDKLTEITNQGSLSDFEEFLKEDLNKEENNFSTNQSNLNYSFDDNTENEESIEEEFIEEIIEEEKTKEENIGKNNQRKKGQ